MEKMKKLDGWGEVTVGNLEAGKQKRKPKGLKSSTQQMNVYILRTTTPDKYRMMVQPSVHVYVGT